MPCLKTLMRYAPGTWLVVRARPVVHPFFSEWIGRVWFQSRSRHGCDCCRIGELHRIPLLYLFDLPISHHHSWRNHIYTRRLSSTESQYIRHCERIYLIYQLFGTQEMSFSEFCVSVAGYRPSGPIRTPLFTPSYSTSTLHVLGRTDVVVVEERSNQLIDVSANQRIEYHPGGTFSTVRLCPAAIYTEGCARKGHFVPSQKPWRDFFRAWMIDPTAKIPSPVPPPSGNP